MATQRLKHKVGDTFSAKGLLRDDSGQPLNLLTAGFTIASQVLADDGRRFPLVAQIGNQAAAPGSFTVTGQTAGWPVDEELRWDIQFMRGAAIQSTETVTIVTLPDVTREDI